MNSEQIAGTVIMLICCWGCAALFLGIGLCACKRKTPMPFWAGTKIDPNSVTDLSAYNRENGRMWMLYSIAYWIAGGCALLGNGDLGAILSMVVLILAVVPGLPMLIREYRRIEKIYIQKA